jgi:hypothetical protein
LPSELLPVWIPVSLERPRRRRLPRSREPTDAAGCVWDGCGCCALSLLSHKVDLKVTTGVVAVDSLYNYELLT